MEAQKSRESLINGILEIELQMFLDVKSESGASCQEQPDAFKQIRGSIYELWSDAMLESYLQDLVMAKQNRRNLVVEKYARMDNLIPQISDNPLIGRIVEIEQKWQEELKLKYPAIYNHSCRDMNVSDNGSNFRVYLASELETYSDNTLEEYYKYVKKMFDNGDSLSIEMLKRLAQKSGYDDLETLEKLMSEGTKK